ncbi:MAG: ferrous iron transport protein B [Proteobacteria bacterium]|nr:ferrous iron transport protein B [Pseudomonadota bacterium]
MSEGALVVIGGNPNTGKTTLFNALTGRRAKIGNYPGITVERRQATMKLDGAAAARGSIEVADLPGSYSLLAHTGEEQIALEAMLGLGTNRKPDVVVLCVDATQVTRGWYLVLQALEHGVRVVVALTMVDEAGDAAPDPSALGRATGCDVVSIVANRGVGLDRLREAIVRAIARPAPEPLWKWSFSPAMTRRLDRVNSALPASWPRTDAMALWALMSIDGEDELVGIDDRLRRVVAEVSDDPRAIDDEVVEGRYRWIDRSIAPLLPGQPDHSLTDRIDSILLHRVAGYAVFLGAMFVVFQALFAWSDPAITLIEDALTWLGGEVRAILPAGIFSDFIVDGLIAGIGSVLVFLPQILLLFFFIGLMEDSGYLARVAYLMDRIMRSMNLHGKAFVPMLSGFACAVPAILATRTMERRRDRLLTMMVVPLMTCSARLPVYTLVIAALFPAGQVLGVFPIQGLLMVCMYLFSTVTALCAAWVLSRLVAPLRAKRLPFVIELPPYRRPRLADVLRMMWERSRLFLTEAGTVILICTAVLWFLLSFPRVTPDTAPSHDDLIARMSSADTAAELDNQRQGEQLHQSYGGRLGRAIEPAIAPLGFDWKIGVGIIGAFAAREVFVSTMGVVYSAGAGADETNTTLRQRMREARRKDDRPVYTPLVGLSLMIFFALACQCMSTLAVVRRETRSYRWPLFLFGYMTALAWIASFLVYQGGRLLGLA